MDNYRTFTLGLTELKFKKKQTVEEFSAESEEAAYAIYLEKKAIHQGPELYYEKYTPVTVIGDNGEKVEYKSMEQAFFTPKKQNIFCKMFDEVKFFAWHWFIDKPSDIKYWFRDLFYWLKHKQNYNAYWSLDGHILETLLHNVPRLIKYKHGIAYPFLDMARIKLHENEKDFDLDAYNKKHYEYTDEEDSLAVKYQDESYNELILNIKLYQYCADYGIVDETNADEVEFDKKWRHILPIKPGTYDQFDVQKLSDLQKHYWNKIWDWMKLYGQTLWD